MSRSGLCSAGASASCSRSRALLNLKQQPRMPNRLPERNPRRPFRRRLLFHGARRRRRLRFHPLCHLTPPLSRLCQWRLPVRGNLRRLRNRLSFHRLRDPAHFRPPHPGQLFRPKPCRLSTRNFKNRYGFVAFIQRNCFSSR